jgi:hypothetical protein
VPNTTAKAVWAKPTAGQVVLTMVGVETEELAIPAVVPNVVAEEPIVVVVKKKIYLLIPKPSRIISSLRLTVS